MNENRVGALSSTSTTTAPMFTEARASIERTKLMDFSEDSVPSTNSGVQNQALPPSSGIGRWRMQQGAAGGMLQVLDVDESEQQPLETTTKPDKETISQGPKWRRTSVEMGLLDAKETGGSQRIRMPLEALAFSEDEVQTMEEPSTLGNATSATSATPAQQGIQRKPSILKESSFKDASHACPRTASVKSRARSSIEWIDDTSALRSDPTLSVPEDESTSTNKQQPKRQLEKPTSLSRGLSNSKGRRASFSIPENPPPLPVSAPVDMALESYPSIDNPSLLPPYDSASLYPPKDSAAKENPPQLSRQLGSFAKGRQRRQSFLDYFTTADPGPSKEDAGPSSRELQPQVPSDELKSSFGKARSRSRSFVELFGLNRSKNDLQQEECLEDPSQAARSKGSFIDFLRFKGGPEEEGDDPSPSAGVSRGKRGQSIDLQNPSSRVKRGQSMDLHNPSRRGSVIMDLFSSGHKGQGKLVSSESMTRRRASVLQRLLSFGKEEEELLAAYKDPEWFTTLADFRPLTHKYHQTKFMDSYFACAIKTGQHHVLKMYHKERMEPSDVRNLQQVLELARWLEHEHMVKVLGTWETDEAFYIVEEYVIRGDILQDSMSYPERYTEKFLVTKVIQPLLLVLVYLHKQHIMHRSIIPEHLLLGREDKFMLGHFVKAVNFSMKKAKDRVGMLDYMPPEMIAIKDEAAEVAPTLVPSYDSPFGAIAVSRSRPNSNSNSAIMVPHNKWEWRDSYDEKVDIWQVGCVVHEILCGCLPFETDNHHLTAALILWADVNFWPETLSPECISFLQACLQKNPELRPSAEDLLKHPWIVKTMAGEGGETGLPSVAQLREAEAEVHKPSGSMKGSLSGRGSQTLNSTSESDNFSSERGGWGFLKGVFGGMSQTPSSRVSPEA